MVRPIMNARWSPEWPYGTALLNGSQSASRLERPQRFWTKDRPHETDLDADLPRSGMGSRLSEALLAIAGASPADGKEFCLTGALMGQAPRGMESYFFFAPTGGTGTCLRTGTIAPFDASVAAVARVRTSCWMYCTNS